MRVTKKNHDKTCKIPVKKRIVNFFSSIVKRRDKEYSKRMLTKIINHSLLMMWGTYLLAWFGKIEIAESLSKTIATSIIAVVVGYLAKSVIENISKNTTTFGQNVPPVAPVIEDDETDDTGNTDANPNRDC